MTNRRDGFVSVVLIILLVILAGLAGYFIAAKKLPAVVRETDTPPAMTTETQTTTAPSQPATGTVSSTESGQSSGISLSVTNYYCPGTQACTQGPLASFNVKIKSNASGAEQQVRTDSAGKARVELPAGTYAVTGDAYRGIASKSFTVEVKEGLFTNFEIRFEQ
jgi:hypothetical protein